MQRDYVTVPRELMLQSKFEWDIDWRGKSTGETNAGFAQIVYNALPRWYGKPELSVLADYIPQWRAFRASARGRKNIFRVPIIDGLTVSRSVWDQYPQGVPLNSEVRLSNGLGFQYSPSFALANVNEFNGAVPFSTTQTFPAGSDYITVVDDGNTGYVPQIGGIHSINDFPYIVTEVQTFDVLAATHVADPQVPFYRLRIETPLRKTAKLMYRTGNTSYSQDRMDILPYGLFVMEDESTGAITYGPNYKSTIKFSFVEWLR